MYKIITILALFLFTNISKADDLVEDKLLGMTTCEAHSKFSLSGSFVPFSKDPSAYSFGDMAAGGSNYVLVIDNLTTKGKCGKIISVLKIDPKIMHNSKNNIGLNCAALFEPFDRYKSYVGLYIPNTSEYTKSINAWVFNFKTMKFLSYSHPSKIYCANFWTD